jgi:diguanylate cyclase (GGDEF)-like protein
MIQRSIREYLLLSISSFGMFVLTLFLFVRIQQADWNNAFLDLVIIGALSCIFYYVYRTRNTEKASYLLGTLAIAGVVFAIWLKGVADIYWAYPVIIASYYLFSVRTALVYSASFMVVIGLIVFKQTPLIDFSTIIATQIMANIFAYFSAKSIEQQHTSLVKSERLGRIRNKALELIVNSHKLSDILVFIVKNVEQESQHVLCSISLLDESGKYLVTGAAPNLPQEIIEKNHMLPVGPESGSCGAAAYYNKRIVVQNIYEDLRWTLLTNVTEGYDIGGCWAEPIISSEGKIIGVFGIYHHKEYVPTEQDFLLVEQFAHLASISIEREQNNLLIWQQANFDSLTGLPNRNMMRSHLTQLISRAERDDEKIAIAFLDLDHFKDVNDTLGHHIGDALLKETATRIKQSIRKNDIVARLGGDEFVIIMSNIKDYSGIEHVAEQLRKSLSLPYYLLNEVVHSGVSIGITLYPDDGTDIDDLLKNADQAMYGAKNLGRNNYHYFTQSMREQAVERMQLISDLRRAISNNEFFVVYQPIVNLQTGQTYKAEALVRWQHPVRGIVSPIEFVALAEETGLIIEISDLVFKQVLLDVTLWRHELSPNFQVSINTSPIQYKKNGGNIKQWIDQINKNECNAKTIALEITENLLMENKKNVSDVLALVKSAGIPISIDDFGTGYSSLAYLKDYETDYLKIDKSFVQKMTQGSKDLALCEAIVVMANKLNIKVIAEGIETIEQQELLTKIGCDFGQGYLFSKPISNKAFEVLVKNKMTEGKVEQT